MKKEKLLLVLLLIGCCPLVYAQQDTIIRKNPIILKWTPTALLDHYASVQFAGEFYYRPFRSVQAEVGVLLPWINLFNIRPQGIRLRVEHRFYITQKKRWYLAPEAHFVFARFDKVSLFSNTWEVDSLSGKKYPIDSYQDKIGVQKIISTANCKIGFQHISEKNNFGIDLYLGLGIRYANTSHTYFPVQGELVPPKDADFISSPTIEGNLLGLNVIGGVKLIYLLRK